MGRRWKLLGSWEQGLKFTAVYYLLEVITSIMKVRGREEKEKGERKTRQSGSTSKEVAAKR